MSKELTYRKLASVSFADVNSENDHGASRQMNMGGRQYAVIHRNRPLMPTSLKIADGSKGTNIPSTSQGTFIIPKMRQ